MDWLNLKQVSKQRSLCLLEGDHSLKGNGSLLRSGLAIQKGSYHQAQTGPLLALSTLP